ncbi:MAG: Asp23/Gls24 family envelope stress response protein [Actinobacteria bacterium]|nr:MAG: Asp23/Gls24 family envelope stress response protein [Actinomycetota bacterium]
MAGKNGKFEFSEFTVEPQVLEEIAWLAASRVDGVAQMAAGGIAGRLKKKGVSGVTATSGDDHIDVEVHLVASYGRPLKELAREVQAAVKESIESMVGGQVSLVDVFVDGIVFPERTQ